MLSYLTGEVPCPTNATIIFSGRLVILDAQPKGTRSDLRSLILSTLSCDANIYPGARLKVDLPDKSEREIYYKGALANTCCDV